MIPSLPKDRPTFEGEIATYWIDDNGILISLSKSIKRTVENIGGNVALVKKITNNKRVPLLIYLTNSPVPDKETQRFSTEQLPQVYTAMAMISGQKLAKFIMNLLFAFKPSPIPMKTFSNHDEAVEWLKQYL